MSADQENQPPFFTSKSLYQQFVANNELNPLIQQLDIGSSPTKNLSPEFQKMLDEALDHPRLHGVNKDADSELIGYQQGATSRCWWADLGVEIDEQQGSEGSCIPDTSLKANLPMDTISSEGDISISESSVDVTSHSSNNVHLIHQQPCRYSSPKKLRPSEPPNATYNPLLITTDALLPKREASRTSMTKNTFSTSAPIKFETRRDQKRRNMIHQSHQRPSVIQQSKYTLPGRPLPPMNNLDIQRKAANEICGSHHVDVSPANMSMPTPLRMLQRRIKAQLERPPTPDKRLAPMPRFELSTRNCLSPTSKKNIQVKPLFSGRDDMLMVDYQSLQNGVNPRRTGKKDPLWCCSGMNWAD